MNIMLENYIRLKNEHEKLKAKYDELKERNPYLDKPRKRKEHFSSSSEQQRKNKKLIVEKLDYMNQNLSQIGLQFTTIEINKKKKSDDTSSKYELALREESHTSKWCQLSKVLKCKDTINLSDRAYNSLRMDLDLNLPVLNDIRDYRQGLDRKFNLFKNEQGVFLSVRQKLEIIFSKLLQFLVLEENESLKLKFSGDGTNIGKKLKLFTFAFTCINDTANCKIANGNYVLGLFEINQENYKELCICLKEIFDEIEALDEIEVANKKYKIKKFLGGDWKFMACVLGLNAANSKYPCLWCTCAQKDFCDLDKTWSIVDVGKGARTMNAAAEKIAEKENLGYVNPSITKGIDFKDCIIDTLHLFLRITDNLTDLLVKKLHEMDGDKPLKIEAHVNFKKYVDFVEKECKLSNAYYARGKSFLLRDLSGGEKEVLFARMKVSELFPDMPDAHAVDFVWSEFYYVYNAVKRNLFCELMAPEIIRLRTRNWLVEYVKIYNRKNVTPYVHAFVFHLHEMIEIHGDINLFNMQGMEKLNDITTQQYFRSCNKRKDEFLSQLIKKKNRIELASF